MERRSMSPNKFATYILDDIGKVCVGNHKLDKSQSKFDVIIGKEDILLHMKRKRVTATLIRTIKNAILDNVHAAMIEKIVIGKTTLRLTVIPIGDRTFLTLKELQSLANRTIY